MGIDFQVSERRTSKQGPNRAYRNLCGDGRSGSSGNGFIRVTGPILHSHPIECATTTVHISKAGHRDPEQKSGEVTFLNGVSYFLIRELARGWMHRSPAFARLAK